VILPLNAAHPAIQLIMCETIISPSSFSLTPAHDSRGRPDRAAQGGLPRPDIPGGCVTPYKKNVRRPASMPSAPTMNARGKQHHHPFPKGFQHPSRHARPAQRQTFRQCPVDKPLSF
jgi:hypothetical protein